MRLLPLQFAAMLLAAVVSHKAAAETVSDGGFESAAVCNTSCYTGNIGDGWTATQGTISILNDTGGAGVPHSGAQFAYIDHGNSSNTLRQTIPTLPGQSCVVSYWVADSNANSLTVRFGSQILFNGGAPALGVPAASDYVNYSFR